MSLQTFLQATPSLSFARHHLGKSYDHHQMKMAAHQSKLNIQSCLPLDIALKIASSLEAVDVEVLGSCSRFWRELCGSDSVWEPLARERWPSVPFLGYSSSPPSLGKGWKGVYIEMHKEMARRASAVVQLTEEWSLVDSMEVGDYYKVVDDLSSKQLAFGDVWMFLFDPRLNVLVNLVGLHYCIFYLQMPVGHIKEVLLRCGIADRQICVKWWKLGRWFYGFRMRDESHSREVSLADLATERGEEVLGVLRRGAVYEVFRVEISISNAASTSWYSHSTQTS